MLFPAFSPWGYRRAHSGQKVGPVFFPAWEKTFRSQAFARFWPALRAPVTPPAIRTGNDLPASGAESNREQPG
jgi:hypothetical protein